VPTLINIFYVTQRLLEKLNQNGVMYKPAAAAASGNNDADLEVDSFENGPPEKKNSCTRMTLTV